MKEYSIHLTPLQLQRLMELLSDFGKNTTDIGDIMLAEYILDELVKQK